MKKALLVFMCLITAVLVTGCSTLPFLYGAKYSVFEQPHQEWVSEEYGIRVISHEKGEQADLIIESDGEEYEFVLDSLSSMLFGVDDNGKEIERWSVHYYKDRFRIEIYDSMFFEKYEEITLYLVTD